MSATKIWKITWRKKKGIISCRFLQVKSGTFWIQFSRDTILNCTETSKETIFCKGINIWHFLYTCMCLFFPCQTLISVLSLGAKFVTEHRKERFNIDEFFIFHDFSCTSSKFLRYFQYLSWIYFLWLWLREVVLRCSQTMLLKSIHMHSLNCLNFDCLCCCFKCWKAPETVRLVILERLEMDVILPPIHLGEQTRNYPQKNFLSFYKKTKCHRWFQVCENTSLVITFLKTL